MEQYLRCYVNHLHDDWTKWLPLVEFAANNQQSESTKLTLFFANIGWDPRITTDLTPHVRGDRDDARAQGMAARIAEIHEFARTGMIDTQQRYQDQADMNQEPTPRFAPGVWTWFLTKNTQSTRPSKKLDYKHLGPFEGMEDPKLKTPYSYRLKFSPDIKVHPIRHISELKPAADDPYPGQVIERPPPVEIDGEEEWEVEEVLDSKIRYRKLQYLLKWIRYDIPEWRDATEINQLQAVDACHRRYPPKPGPLPEVKEGDW